MPYSTKPPHKYICPEKLVIYLYPDVRVPQRKHNRSRKFTGRITGMTYHQYWCFLFRMNEQLPREKKMTDFAIAKNVAMEFPANVHIHKLFDVKFIDSYSVRKYRERYNFAGLGNAYEREDVPAGLSRRKGPFSFRYNDHGYPISSMLKAKNPLSVKRIAAILEKRRGLDDIKPIPVYSKLASKGLDCEKSCEYPLHSVSPSAKVPPCPLNRKRCSRNCEAVNEPNEAEKSATDG